jgi:hypothetical protein
VEVPWAESNNGQRRDITEGELSETTIDETAVEQRLQDLGYV